MNWYYLTVKLPSERHIYFKVRAATMAAAIDNLLTERAQSLNITGDSVTCAILIPLALEPNT